MLRQLPRFVMVIGALVVMSTSAHAERGNSDVQLDGQTIDMMVSDFMRDHDIPGMTLAIVQAPYISRLVGYGVQSARIASRQQRHRLFPARSCH